MILKKTVIQLSVLLSCFEHAQTIITKENVESFLVNIKSSLGIDTSSIDRERHLESRLGCHALESRVYANTTIAPAEFLTFAMNRPWEDPGFDLEAFFDEMNFQRECEHMGGEVIQVDYKLDSGSEIVLMENYRLCKPKFCDIYEYLLTKRMVNEYFAPYLKSEIELSSDEIPSQQCLNDMVKTYNETALSPYSPEAFLANGGAVFVEVS